MLATYYTHDGDWLLWILLAVAFIDLAVTTLKGRRR